jgi:hypothetical protein
LCGVRREEVAKVRNYGYSYAAVRLKSSCTGPRFGGFAAVPQRTEWAADEMKTLRSELDERLDDLVEAVGQTVGQRIDLLEEETDATPDSVEL